MTFRTLKQLIDQHVPADVVGRATLFNQYEYDTDLAHAIAADFKELHQDAEYEEGPTLTDDGCCEVAFTGEDGNTWTVWWESEDGTCLPCRSSGQSLALEVESGET